MSAPLLMRFIDRTMQGPYFHLTSVSWSRNALPRYHTHDYHEIFWLTSGTCNHLINGEVEELQTGEIVLLRVEDCHQLKAQKHSSGFQFTNLALSPCTIQRLQIAYPQEVNRLYPKSGPALHRRIIGADLDALNTAMQNLAKAEHSRIAIERAVLAIWSLFLAPPYQGLDPASNLPEWLQTALIKVQEPEVHSLGVAGFVDVAGRSQGHVTRACRTHLGQSPTQIINRARLQRAAHSLRFSSRSVLDIALDCGFQNPAQFHRIFRASFGTTPGQFRRAKL